jgi:lipid II:glycine glycyltransferase (peptidoglycan interpeptide bridge formation enzyme)
LKGGRFLKGLVPGDLESCNRAESFLQSDFWGSFKARFGWNARPFLVSWNWAEKTGGGAAYENTSQENAKPLLVIRRRLAAGVSFSYVPWGPELPAAFPAEARYAALAELAEALKAFLPKDTAFIRFDPPWYAEGAAVFPPPPGDPFVRAGADVQPPDTVLVNLNQTMDSLLGGMKPKWRYNARLALKKGVVIRRADEAGLDVFYSLLKETARRDGIAIHGIQYYQTLFSHCGEYGKNRGAAAGNAVDLRLYIAEHEGSPLAAIIVLLRGGQAVYLYGASSDRERGLMAPYALQVKAMEDAMASGCGEYDLFGIPPVSAEDAPDHPMAGLYRFKTGFGGRVIHRPGSWDYPLRPFVYHLFRTAESLRKRLRAMKKNMDARKRRRHES